MDCLQIMLHNWGYPRRKWCLPPEQGARTWNLRMGCLKNIKQLRIRNLISHKTKQIIERQTWPGPEKKLKTKTKCPLIKISTRVCDLAGHPSLPPSKYSTSPTPNITPPPLLSTIAPPMWLTPSLFWGQQSGSEPIGIFKAHQTMIAWWVRELLCVQ